MNEEEKAPVPVSAINHYLFCERRCALIHGEGVFEENRYTLEGRFAHERADAPGEEERDGVRLARAVPLFSVRLGLVGKADVIEFWKGKDGREIPFPVDYKRGPRKRWDNDDAQLCAQALCLEEMLGVAVPAGAVYHIASKRRREVAFTAELRALVERVVGEMRGLIASGTLPAARLKPRCDGCSLRSACMPELASEPGKVGRYVGDLFASSGLSGAAR